MKKFFTLISMFALCLGMGAQTQTSLIEAYQIYALGANGHVGSTAQLTLNMKNRNAIRVWTCTLVLPEGITYQDAELYTDGGCYPDGYNAEFKKTVNNDGSVTFACSGEEGVALVGTNDATIAVVTVNIANTVQPGKYVVTLKDIKLEEPNGSMHEYTNNGKQTEFEWTIEEAVEGTITFDLKGAPGEYAPITVPVGDAIDAPDDPEWEGHTFLGWVPAIPETMPEGGLNVEAQWATNKYAILVEGEGVEVSERNPEWGTSVTVTINEIPNMVFEKLFVTPEGTPAEIDVTNSVVDNQYVIENVTCNYIVHAFFRSTVEAIIVSQEYTPYSCAYDLDFTGSDLKAYIASGFNKSTNQAILVNVTDVPAYTGVLLIGQPGREYDIPQSQSSSYFVNLFQPFVEGGWLAPAGETINAEPYVNYVFAVVNGEPGFYSLESEEGTIPGATPNGVDLPFNSAYLQLPRQFASSAVKIGFIFEDDVIDGINGIEATDSQTIFDLQGRRVNKAVKGIYIVNGKKIAVK